VIKSKGLTFVGYAAHIRWELHIFLP